MQAIRKIYEHITSNINVPKELLHRRVEVIMLPLDESVKDSNFAKTTEKWPANFFELTAGCLIDDPLTRFEQGIYEERDMLK